MIFKTLSEYDDEIKKIDKMIDEELLISYLQKQKRKYQEQMIALHRKVENFSTNNNEQEYIITAMCDSIESIIQIHTDLIERIKNKEFDSFFKTTKDNFKKRRR